MEQILRSLLQEDIPSANIDEPSDFYKAESLLNDWDQK